MKATCISSYFLSTGYILFLVVIWTKSWKAFSIPILLFVGMKCMAIFFYHYMEFTSDIPPENLVPYFSVEGPYVFSMILIVKNVHEALQVSGEVVRKRSSSVGETITVNRTDGISHHISDKALKRS